MLAYRFALSKPQTMFTQLQPALIPFALLAFPFNKACESRRSGRHGLELEVVIATVSLCYGEIGKIEHTDGRSKYANSDIFAMIVFTVLSLSHELVTSATTSYARIGRSVNDHKNQSSHDERQIMF